MKTKSPSFKVSWFLGFKVSKIQKLINVGRDRAHITKFHFMCLIDTDPIFNFFKIFEMDLHDVSALVFSERSKQLMSGIVRFTKIISPKNIVCFLHCLEDLGVSKDNIGLGSQGHVPKCENHEHEGSSVSPITKSKSY